MLKKLLTIGFIVCLVFIYCDAVTDKYKRTSAFAATKITRTGSIQSNITTYDNIVTNVGNDFDNAAGSFTCRVPGLYFFKFHFPQTAMNSQNSTITLFKNSFGSAETEITSAFEPALRVDYGGGGALAELVAGERVYLYLDGSLYLQGDKPLVFNGFLLYRTV